MTNSNLLFKIIIQAVELEVMIDNLDIDFQIFKSLKSDINTAVLRVWNLDDTTYQKLFESDCLIDILVQYGDEDPLLMFRGYLDKSSTFRRNPEIRVEDNLKMTTDIPALLKLIDGKIVYSNSYINKNYRETISSTRIIQDCIEAMGIDVAHNSTQLPEKQYRNFKAIGRPHVILEQICKTLGIRSNIQNGLLYLINGSVSVDESAIITLNDENSLCPLIQGRNEIIILSSLFPGLNPNEFVKCSFEGLEGVFQVLELCLDGNNYGLAGTTKITIGLTI